MLWFVSVVVLEIGGNPADPSSGDEVAQYFLDDRTAILVAGTLHVLGGFFFLWFVAVLGSVLRVVDASLDWLRSALLVGGTAAAALMLALTGPQTSGATTDRELVTPDAAIGFWRGAHGFFVGAEFAFAVFVAALSLLALANVLLPRWLGWTGLPIALLLLIVPIGWAALLLLVPVWLVVVSVITFARMRRPVPA